MVLSSSLFISRRRRCILTYGHGIHGMFFVFYQTARMVLGSTLIQLIVFLHRYRCLGKYYEMFNVVPFLFHIKLNSINYITNVKTWF